MLGEKIGSDKGKITARRVLDGDPGRVEITFEAEGSLLGLKTREIGTYTSAPRPDGTLYGEGQGVVMGPAGEVATWKGQGVGVFKPGGALSFRGAIYYQTQVRGWSRLNSCAVVYEHECAADGSVTSEITEWR